MTLVYFGEKWNAAVFESGALHQVATPVGSQCYHCLEAVIEGDRGYLHPVADSSLAGRSLPIHRECQLRLATGGLDHVQGRCEYRGHCNELREAAGRSIREDALAVWEWFQH